MTNHYGFPTAPPVTVDATEIQNIVGNLVASNLWFEVNPLPDDLWTVRVRNEALVVLHELRNPPS